MSEKVVPLKDLFEKKLKEQWYSDDTRTTPDRKRLPKYLYKTGFKHITKVYCQSCKKKFTYQYEYYDKNNKRRYLTSVDFFKLKEKAKKIGLEWTIDSMYYARKTAKELGVSLGDLR